MLALGNKIIAGSFKAGASWEVGDVGISAFGIDEALNKRRYLNGQVISQAQFVEFTAMLKSRVSVYPSLATTEVNWQAEVTNSALGQCGKFVIDDDAGTIRLPKVINIQGLQNLTGLGGIKAESLPNITGMFALAATDLTAYSGPFFPTTTGKGVVGSSWTNNMNSSFDASLSSSTYQDDAPVQQEAVQYPYFIQVAEGVETSIDVSREIELNNPFSLLDYKYSEYELSNASWLLSNGQWNSGAVYQSVYDLLLQIYNGTVTKAGVSVKLSTEAYADTDFVLNTTDTTFRLPLYTQRVLVKKYVNGTEWYNLYSDGWCEQGGFVATGTAPTTVTLLKEMADTNYYANAMTNTSRTNPQNYDKIIQGKTTTSITVNQFSNWFDTFDWQVCGYCNPSSVSEYTEIKGLYFYVGETVQDAGLINAGQMSTLISQLTECHVVVETYVNGTSWYRVYSDGWCEQGGYRTDVSNAGVTVNLAKPFTDTNYTITIAIGGAYGTPCGADTVTASSFVLKGQSYYNGVVWWQACGYIS